MGQEEILRKIFLFQDLEEAEVGQIISISAIKAVPKDQVIFEEGAEGDALYIVLEGAVRVSKIIPGMGEENLVILGPGHYFGEMALIEDTPRSATLIAHEDCRLLFVGKEDFRRLLKENKEIAYKLLWVFCRTLCQRLRETNEKLSGIFAIAKNF